MGIRGGTLRKVSNLARLHLDRECFLAHFGVVYIISHGSGNLLTPVLSVAERSPAHLNRPKRKIARVASI